MLITSPESMAVSSPHFFQTVSRPRRFGDLSIMSSCMRVKVWNTSSAAAGSSISSPSSSRNMA